MILPYQAYVSLYSGAVKTIKSISKLNNTLCSPQCALQVQCSDQIRHVNRQQLRPGNLVLSHLFQSWHAIWRCGGGDQRGEGEHLRGDLPGRPQQRQNHHGGAEGEQTATTANDSRVHRVTLRKNCDS